MTPFFSRSLRPWRSVLAMSFVVGALTLCWFLLYARDAPSSGLPYILQPQVWRHNSKYTADFNAKMDFIVNDIRTRARWTATEVRFLYSFSHQPLGITFVDELSRDEAPHEDIERARLMDEASFQIEEHLHAGLFVNAEGRAEIRDMTMYLLKTDNTYKMEMGVNLAFSASLISDPDVKPLIESGRACRWPMVRSLIAQRYDDLDRRKRHADHTAR